MNKPQSNGLVELVDEKQLDSRAWNTGKSRKLSLS